MRILLPILLALVPLRQARAQDDVPVPSHECCADIRVPVGARNVALGGAVVADTSIGALYDNPAALAGVHRTDLLIHHKTLPDNGQITALSVTYAPKDVGTFGLSYELVDRGELQQTDINGNPIGSISLQAHLITASFATGLVAGLSAGISYKLFLCGTECGKESVATTQLIDAGVQYRPPWLRALALGAAVVDAGLPLQVVNYEQADLPPTRVHVGASYEVLHYFHTDSILSLRLSGEVEAGGERVLPLIGAELSVANAVFIRSGYRSGGAVDSGLAMGIGLEVDRFTLSVGKAFSSSVFDPSGQAFHISFGVKL